MAVFLQPDKIRLEKIGEKTLTIKTKIIPNSLRASKTIAAWVKKGGKMKPCALLNDKTGKPKGITIHNTGDIRVPIGTTPAEQYCRATYNENMKGAIVHFYVYKNDIWQLLEENEQGWHASDGITRRTDHRGGLTGGNIDTIAIECIGDIKASEQTTAYLTAYLCKKYDLDPRMDVYTHNWWMHHTDNIVPGADKNCPIYILNEWKTFLDEIYKYYADGLAYDLNNSNFPLGDDDMGIVYNTINDVPAGEFRDIITTLMNTPVKHGKGNIINGYGDGTIRLTENMVRLLVINYRAGLYDNL
jgi:hypothetical protein